MRPLGLIRAPCNLGLRPLRPGHAPGAWRAPEALAAAGLEAQLVPASVTALARPAYSPEPQPGTRLYNGRALRAFNLLLAGAVEAQTRAGRLPVVIGGDCAVLLGALAGARRAVGPLGLVHIDGHSDFRHPGNWDPQASLGAVAGMDLALATGRGEALMTDWPGAPAPLVADAHVFQLGEREGRLPDWPWRDIAGTAIARLEVWEALPLTAQHILARIDGRLAAAPGGRFWTHLDIDVLDATIFPAVDSPGSPGLDPEVVAAIVGTLAAREGCAGLTVTVFDPDLDPDGACARRLTDLLATALRPA